MNKFTEIFPEDLAYNKKSRIQKAKKIQAILDDYFYDTKGLDCLDLGCSVGIITNFFGRYFRKVIGIDVDNLALIKAKKNNINKNVNFIVSKENKIPFKDNSFDVVVFNQIYEHVENPEKIMIEIRRVLKKRGICFFGARNKFAIFDGHYSLPFISWLPRVLADIYIQKTTAKKKYDIKLYSYWQLKKLVNDFKLMDYTLEVINNPKKYKALEVVPSNIVINKIVYLFSKLFYILIPNYLWILKRK